MAARPVPYQAVIRRNLRRLRMKFGWRQEDLAMRARAKGLRWSASTVTAIEVSRRPVSAGELLVLPTILRVSLAELLLGEQDEVVDVDGVLVTQSAINQIARGAALDEPQPALFAIAPGVQAGATDAERKAAKNVSKATSSTITAQDLIARAQLLWDGRRLDEERDRRLNAKPGQGNLARRRGHITGLLQKELLEDLLRTKARKEPETARRPTRRLRDKTR